MRLFASSRTGELFSSVFLFFADLLREASLLSHDSPSFVHSFLTCFGEGANSSSLCIRQECSLPLFNLLILVSSALDSSFLSVLHVLDHLAES
jgi:hypothetical protein